MTDNRALALFAARTEHGIAREITRFLRMALEYEPEITVQDLLRRAREMEHELAAVLAELEKPVPNDG